MHHSAAFYYSSIEKDVFYKIITLKSSNCNNWMIKMQLSSNKKQNYSKQQYKYYENINLIFIKLFKLDSYRDFLKNLYFIIFTKHFIFN